MKFLQLPIYSPFFSRGYSFYNYLLELILGLNQPDFVNILFSDNSLAKLGYLAQF